MIKRILQLLLIGCLPIALMAQNKAKKVLGHEELITWNKISNQQISNDGKWVTYEVNPEEGDGFLKIVAATQNNATVIERGEKAKISSDNRFVVFTIKPPVDTVKMMRRNKVKKEDLPKKTLGIHNLQTGKTERIDNIESFKLPEDWAGWLIYKKESEKIEIPEEVNMTKRDSSQTKEKKQRRKRPKKESKKDGTKLVVRNLATGQETIFPYVVHYQLAQKGQKILLQTTGNDSTFLNGIYLYQPAIQLTKPLFRGKGDYKRMVLDEQGDQVAFLANFDTTNALVPPFELAYWKSGQDSAHIIAQKTANFLPTDWIINEHKTPRFSKNGQKLYFGMSPEPIIKDTSLLEEEIVKVEVWHWNDAQLYTQQESNQKDEERRSYSVVWHTQLNRFVPLGSLDIPEIRMDNDANVDQVLGYTTAPYAKVTSWEGGPIGRDLYLIDTRTGTKKTIAKGVRGTTRLSPNGQFVYSYVAPDSAWYTYNVQNGNIKQLTDNTTHSFYDELNDRPMHPTPYGLAGWIENDRYVLLYDRYDIWKVDPKGIEQAINLTNGRASKIRYRNVRLDREKEYIGANDKLLLQTFDGTSKEAGFSRLDLTNGQLTQLSKGPYTYGRRPIKAKNADKLIYTRSNFEVFPDVHYTDLDFKNSEQISLANPQQKDYLWGTQELYEWTSLDGKRLKGLLVKPENFDPTKKYPMIVNFYERSSDGLFRHRAPSAGRSTINYPFYASRGYIIFNPDVPYRVGYPGESCYNSVIPGVTALINEGFIDKENIAVQGHSWGGYQIAYLLTKTDIFKCAESGAPVVNMFSAYGGIRWGSGMSRMFQYEHTQSRIGGSIWEYPLRYIENSPIFEMDKTNTPVLIMHNDEDTAVPWYQGIEYFVALRRLGKPAWLLNYNGEPHWPVKLQNRKDFNIRMQQYFDYYLKGAPMPKWMEGGVSAVEKGKRQGLELIENKN